MLDVRLKGIGARLRDRARLAWGDALVCALAVAIAWMLARGLAGHSQPMFAVVASVVCLAPGLPNHGRQALAMLSGVLTGIAIGEASLLIPLGDDPALSVLRLAAVTFLAILVASLWGQGAVAAIQSGVSALMVLTMGAVTAGPERILDVLIGTAVGLSFSQILLTPDPMKTLEGSARKFLAELGQGMLIAERAVRERDPNRARIAARRLGAARGRLVALDGGISLARDNARWSLRGLSAGPEVLAVADRYDRHAARIYAQALILGDELYHALRDEARIGPPEGLADLLHRVAAGLGQPGAGAQPAAQAARLLAAVPADAPHWRAVVVQALDLSAGGQVLLALPEQGGTGQGGMPPAAMR
uniref:FUSC family protein n=1 Tax=Paenirhodobacter enshiensis TaxID=1105367 RepID=UPI0035B1AD61